MPIQIYIYHFVLKYFYSPLNLSTTLNIMKCYFYTKLSEKVKQDEVEKTVAGNLWRNNKKSLASGEAFINIFTDQHCQMFKFILPFENSQIPYRLFGVE